MKKDIENREDIKLLVDTFYASVKQNEIIGYIFEEVAQVNWESHLPKMYAFWTTIILDEPDYTGNPMIKHIALSKITRMSKVEFSEWLRLFNETVEVLFEGTKAELAKFKADGIANLMLHKIQMT